MDWFVGLKAREVKTCLNADSQTPAEKKLKMLNRWNRQQCNFSDQAYSTRGVKAQMEVLGSDGKEAASQLQQNQNRKRRVSKQVYRFVGGKLKVRQFQDNDFYLFVMSKE